MYVFVKLFMLLHVANYPFYKSINYMQFMSSMSSLDCRNNFLLRYKNVFEVVEIKCVLFCFCYISPAANFVVLY